MLWTNNLLSFCWEKIAISKGGNGKKHSYLWRCSTINTEDAICVRQYISPLALAMGVVKILKKYATKNFLQLTRCLLYFPRWLLQDQSPDHRWQEDIRGDPQRNSKRRGKMGSCGVQKALPHRYTGWRRSGQSDLC